MRTVPAALLLLAAEAAASPAVAQVTVAPTDCAREVAGLERPAGATMPPEIVESLRALAAEALAFAADGNEQACEIRRGHLLAILGNYAPGEGARGAHAARLQAARPFAPAPGAEPDSVDDAEVWSPSGEWLGEADRLALDPARPGTGWLLVERDGWLAVDSGTVAVPLDKVLVTEDGEAFVLPVTRERFATAPSLPGAEGADRPEEMAEIDAFWEAEPRP